MPEQINLAAPDQQVAGASDYLIGEFSINMGYNFLPSLAAADINAARISVALVSSNRLVRRLSLITGQAAITAARQLNKANLSGANKSLERRLLELVLALDAKYAGNITGAADAP